jgi:hypothetical protein
VVLHKFAESAPPLLLPQQRRPRAQTLRPASVAPAPPASALFHSLRAVLKMQPRATNCAMPSTFKAALAAALRDFGLNAATREHLKRWADDDRAEEVWDRIKYAAQKHGTPLTARFFIMEILSARRVAELIDQRRTQRGRYRGLATQMEEIASFLRERPFQGGPPPIPFSVPLARMLKDAAKILRREAAVSFTQPGLLKVSRSNRDRAREAFTSMVSNDLKRITGRWLDEDVAVLTEIALNIRDITVDQVRWARQPARSGRAKRSTAGKG